MPASSVTAFDTLAADYDSSFSRSLTGSSQRMQSRKWLSAFLKDKQNLCILEINCGTGDDALWLASLGHQVVATDASAAMIQEAKTKQVLHSSQHPVQFLQCDFTDLHAGLEHQKFDLIFSNFSGLNCVPANKLRLLNNHFHDFLNPGAHIAVVIFGKYNWWETFYYLLKLNPVKALRRWRNGPSFMKSKDGHTQPVYYYSIRRFLSLLNQFTFIEKRPVGLFIPPSYLEPFMQKNPRLFRFLEKLEQKAGGLASFTQFADHSYVLLKKEER
ncbi:MAG: class I SAM-dependent methyltransferase [Chitinophagaceae bacterium]